MAGCKPGKHGPEDLSHIQIVRILFSQKKCRKHFFNIGWLRTAKTDNSALCRKASSNTSVSFCSARILRYFYGIMVPQSVGVAVRKEPLNHDVRFYFQRYRHGIIVPKSVRRCFLPRKRSEWPGKTDSAANNVSGGVCEAYVAVRKEPLNHDVRFYIQRYRHGIMVPQSYDVVAEICTTCTG